MTDRLAHQRANPVRRKICLFHRWVVSTILVLIPIQPSHAASKSSPPKTIIFERHIEPILKAHCYKCHGPKTQKNGFRLDSHHAILRGGDSGEPGVVLGKASKSHLIRLVKGLEKDAVMPPKGRRLTAAEIELLSRWIDQGMKWRGGKIGSNAPIRKLTTDHWSFKPVQRPTVPKSLATPNSHPIDAFIQHRLNEKGLTYSKRADRRTLIRRLYLAMHGLPPTPAQVKQFLRDQSPQAWTRLIERVLKSPRYGERWARHWLDVVRFAETNGFETNTPRPNAWRYRDYVINSLNADKPYNRFIFEQLAGDSVGVDVATGFIVGGPTDVVKSPDANLTLMQRQDELADMVNTTGTAFLGLTMGCARCHNHKFDPILQRDYYTMQAVFAGVTHGDRPARGLGENKRAAELAKLKRTIVENRKKLNAMLPDTRQVAVANTILIDDEDVASGRVTLLAKKRGHGANPPGPTAEIIRGYKNDLGGPNRLPNISRGRYTWWEGPQIANRDLMTYQPRATGKYRLWLSWGAGWHTHATNATYWIDSDGDLATTNDRTLLATVDQQRFANRTGQVVNKPLWSGFQDVGVWTFQPKSKIILKAGPTAKPVTADVIALQSVKQLHKPAKGRPTLPSLRTGVNAKRNEEYFNPIKAKWVRFTVHRTNSAEPCIDELEIYAAGTQTNIATHGKPTSSGNYANNPKHKLEHINDGIYGNGRSWISNTNGAGWIQIELKQPTTIDRIVWGRDRQLRYQDRLATQYRIEVAIDKDKWITVADSTDRLAVNLNSDGGLAAKLARLSPDKARIAESLIQKIRSYDARLAQLSKKVLVYAGRFANPGPTHRLYRGDPMAKREVVPPDTLEVLHKDVGQLKLKSTSPDQKRRIGLANWITNDQNPLTPRVIVNRIWAWHFGTGIVNTPSDFGGNGGSPSHPELLDYLASELIENGWSLKHIHRLILTSKTYQQTGKASGRGVKLDANVRYLWRFPSRRVEAEVIRDNILATSGVLDLQMGGPGFSLFKPNTNYVRVYTPKEIYGPAEWRRMIYMTKVRMEHDDVFGVFDCPDAGQPTAKRIRSTTAIQALNLFNSAFVLQQANLFAKRIRKEAGANPSAQVNLAFTLAYGRKPTSKELHGALRLAKNHSLTAVCRAILNSSEFMFLP